MSGDPRIEQAWLEIRDTFADSLMNQAQKETFVKSILGGVLAHPPSFEVVPEGTKDLENLIKEAYQICVVKGMALSLIINGHQNANKEAFTFSEQKKDWGLVAKNLRDALDILAAHRAAQKEGG